MHFPLSTLQARVAKGVMRDDLAAITNNYADFINTALKEYQDKRSWLAMRTDDNFTIHAGDLTVKLPDNFKELQARHENPPVTINIQDPSFPGGERLIEVLFEEEQLRRLWAWGGVLGAFFAQGFTMFSVSMVRDATGTYLRLATPNIQDLTFHVRYYQYLPELVNATDESPLANAYPEMVIAKAKSIALANVNDPAADGLETFAQKKFMEAMLSESRAEYVGRPMHM